MEPRQTLAGIAQVIADAGLAVYRPDTEVYGDDERPVFPTGYMPARGEHITLLSGEFVRGAGRGAGALPVQVFIRAGRDRMDAAELATAIRRLFEGRRFTALGIADVTFQSGGGLGINDSGQAEHSLNLLFLGRRPM